MELREQIRREYVVRRQKNPAYSMRAFARALDVDQSLLSKIMNGSRAPSSEVVMRVSRRLGLEIPQTSPKYKAKRALLQSYEEIRLEADTLLSHWEHFAILELAKTKRFKPDAQWMAQRLGLSKLEIEAAVERLVRFGFLETSGAKWKLKSPNHTWTSFEKSSDCRRFLQRKLIERALVALEHEPHSRRENASLTIQCSARLIPEVKRRIDKFISELDRWIDDQGPHDEVYQLIVGMFPLSQGADE